MIHLETPRLIIRDHIDKDLEDLHSLISDEKAMYYLPEVRTRNHEESKENLMVAIYEASLDNREKYFFAIIEKESGKYIGEIGFTVLIDCLYGKVVNLGYFIKPEYWRKGITAEAAREVIDFAFKEGGVIKIETGCVKENTASEKVMLKIGMLKEAELKMHVYLNNKLYDRVEYRMLKDEWLGVKEKE
jgi:[ribosomal protein S5]-alanine N-acetyltransferase